MEKYELPEALKKQYEQMRRDLAINEDLLRKLSAAGAPAPELEMKISELKGRLERFAKAFELEE